MKELCKPLAAIVCAALVLLAASLALGPIRARTAEQERQSILEALLPGSVNFQEEPYAGGDESIRAVYKGENGYVVETVTAGYVGDVTLWVGVNTDGAVSGITVHKLSETFGLGQRAASDVEFLSQFLGTDGGLTVGENVDAMTGATVSSKAVTKGVNAAAGFVTGADVATSATEWGG